MTPDEVRESLRNVIREHQEWTALIKCRDMIRRYLTTGKFSEKDESECPVRLCGQELQVWVDKASLQPWIVTTLPQDVIAPMMPEILAMALPKLEAQIRSLQKEISDNLHFVKKDVDQILKEESNGNH